MREIVLDTETTGLDPASGHRIVEIACLELINHLPSGRRFQRYLNPDRDMPEDAFAVHGLTAAFLADKPRFGDVAAELLAFIDGAPLVIHNAEFDMRFLNAELAKLEQPGLPGNQAVDTLMLARRKFPGSPASLDAASASAVAATKSAASSEAAALPGSNSAASLGPSRPPRPHAPTPEELAAWAAMLAKLKEPLWNN